MHANFLWSSRAVATSPHPIHPIPSYPNHLIHLVHATMRHSFRHRPMGHVGPGKSEMYAGMWNVVRTEIEN